MRDHQRLSDHAAAIAQLLDLGIEKHVLCANVQTHPAERWMGEGAGDRARE